MSHHWPRLLLAIIVGAAIGLIVGYVQRLSIFRGVDLIEWLKYDRTALLWLALGAVIFGGLWHMLMKGD